jgi:hypothetical protein
MIDQEDVIYEAVSAALRRAFDGIFITGVEITDTPPRFPAASIVQLNSTVNARYSTFEKVDNVAAEEYKFDVYSNLESQKEAKQQTKDIVAVIDGVMSDFFYIRSFCQPIPGVDAKNTRRVARYKNNNIVP